MDLPGGAIFYVNYFSCWILVFIAFVYLIYGALRNYWTPPLNDEDFDALTILIVVVMCFGWFGLLILGIIICSSHPSRIKH
jgi:hypothetical protein